MLTNDIRSLFLNYYKNNNHTVVESSNLVPTNDDTLLFTNSGMVPFKNYFTGLQTPAYNTAVSAQKCIRAGGKHNDLDNVGYTARHHTFFEMLGNFSFGDYFKEQAIYYAWDFITKQLALPTNKLCVTVYHTDDEAFNLWKKISNLSNDNIIKINTDDNFWSMGDTGPCGPCSEIFYDYGDKVFGGKPGTANQNGDRFVEIWNLVFMQFEKNHNNPLQPLQKKSIDTGMGLERLASVIQGKTDNYNTDTFVAIMQAIETELNVKKTATNITAFKVIADHLRAIAFLISENILPSNEGRGYVLRRIIRRAIRYAYFLGAKQPVLHKIIISVINTMGGFYIQLLKTKDLITNTLHQEEIKFFETFANGITLLNKEISNLSGNTFSGITAFKLYDTYGFPVDLTESILQQHNIKLNITEFNTALENHKNLAKQSWVGSGQSTNNPIWFNLQNKFTTQFTGYTTHNQTSQVLAIINNNLQEVQSLSQGQQGYVILNSTPFYSTMGGQQGDSGTITNQNANVIVETTVTNNLIIAHKVTVQSGTLSVNQQVQASVNSVNRNLLSKHHTATHLLQAALIKVLGNHVTQQGSMVSDSRLRFDVSHNKPITVPELEQAENLVNQAILQALPVTIQSMPTATAINQGALAMFGEKYPEIARTVKVGNNDLLSFELCGGTHVNNTAEIGVFKILSESSLASGVRRIEAVCSTAVLNVINSNTQMLNNIHTLLNSTNNNVINKINTLQQDNKQLKDNLETTNNKYYNVLLQNKFVNSNGKSVLCTSLPNATGNLKDIANALLQNKTNTLVALFMPNSNNVLSYVVAVSKDLSSSVNLKTLSATLNQTLNAKGGGSNVFIQGTGQAQNLQQAFAIVNAL